MSQKPAFNFDNTFSTELEGFYVPWKGDTVPEPKILRLNKSVAQNLGVDANSLTTDIGAAILSGAANPEGGAPLAMAYAGHQFGAFSPQLGDGRAILIGEVIGTDGARYDIHLKGSGATPFSRGGDGKAVLGPVLREYLFGEAMHALGIPTTRGLAATTTGEQIARNGPEPGAVLARVASSHLRVGTFQFFAARGETDKVRQLADYAIARHDPELIGQPDVYLEFLRRVSDRQACLVASWVLVGFVHGVMNTDNMSISGETIDYGPCAFIDSYDPAAVFSSIDRHGRYAYGNQPIIAQWNLARFAETLIDLINPNDKEDAIKRATSEINAFGEHYQLVWLEGMRRKLGFFVKAPEDLGLINGLYEAMDGQNVDFTKIFRALADAVRGDKDPALELFDDPELKFTTWLEKYERRLAQEDIPFETRATAMDKVNPVYIPRNHKVEEAIVAAGKGDMKPFDQLVKLLRQPFSVRDGFEDYGEPAPEGFGPYKTFCGT